MQVIPPLSDQLIADVLPRRAITSASSVVDFFEAQVARTPHATAVAFEGLYLSYDELNARSNQIARLLRREGVGPEVLVGMQLSRSAEIVVALLAILKAGGAYLPLDPALPLERLATLLKDARAHLVLTEEALRGRLTSPTRVVCIDSDRIEFERQSRDNLERTFGGENLAYVIYTSGSTGRPKGVAIEHRNLSSYVRALIERLDLPAGCSFGHVSTFAADLGHTALFPSLCTGGTLHVISADRTADGDAFARYCERYPIDVLKIVPSHLSALLDGGGGAVLPRRYLVLGGESSSWRLIARIRALNPSCAIFNHYGPTETTVGAIAGRVGDEAGLATVPLGTPLGNARVWIADESGSAVPDGERGELTIGGGGVGRGYWNDRELTDARFVRDPSGGRAFKTGDRARRLESGEIEFLGRFDHQVKIRGFRVELGEIEVALAESGYRNAVAVREEISGEKRLVAYVVSPEKALSVSDLKAVLRARLPEHMVPSLFVPMAALPLTENGKIDRSALPARLPDELDRVSRYVEPRDEIERTLAAIWAELFGLERVGVTDDFFDLGGHSLLAARMTARIARTLGKRLPATIVLEASTIEQIAKAVKVAERDVAVSSLVPLQAEGEGPPLFCLHAGMGTILFYVGLAKRFEFQRPVYALKPRGLEDDALPHAAIEEMIAAYLDEVRRVQPRGPYHILGFCFGAVLALEMAQQLRAAGEEIAFLGAMDGGFDYRTKEASASSWTRRQVSELKEISARERVRILAQKAKRRVAIWARLAADEAWFRAAKTFPPLRRKISPEIRARYIRRNHRRIGKKYVARPYAGDLVLFASQGVYADPLLGWRTVIRGRIELHEVGAASPDYYPDFWEALQERTPAIPDRRRRLARAAEERRVSRLRDRRSSRFLTRSLHSRGSATAGQLSERTSR